MTIKSELGQYGEELACKYLVNKGYKIIERNFRKPWGEVDIIARANDKTLVFVEVKTMKELPGGLMPEDQLTKSKLEKLTKTALLYAGHFPQLINKDRGWRIDLVAIDMISHPLTKDEKNCEIKQYENVSG